MAITLKMEQQEVLNTVDVYHFDAVEKSEDYNKLSTYYDNLAGSRTKDVVIRFSPLEFFMFKSLAATTSRLMYLKNRGQGYCGNKIGCISGDLC